MIRTLLHGSGRMAQRVLAQLAEDSGFDLQGVVARAPAEDLSGIECYTSFANFDGSADLLIDFTLPAGTRAAAKWCSAEGVAFLTGTTGLSAADREILQAAANRVAVMAAPNLSYGVALVKSLVRQAATALDQQARTRITETHHKHKLDAPSGTALDLAAAVLAGRDEPVEQLLEPARLQQMIDTDDGDLAFTSIRAGEVIGTHTVSFTLAGEIIEITHKALDRDIFASGALKAAKWLLRQPPGYYTTDDWLG